MNIIFIFFVIIFLVYLCKRQIYYGGKIKLHKSTELLIQCCKKLKLKYNLINNHTIHIMYNN